MTRIRQSATRSFALLSLFLLLSFSPATIAQQKVEINEKRYDFAQLVNRLSEKGRLLRLGQPGLERVLLPARAGPARIRWT